ncbi:MAG: geranylgeranyl reductase family protein [Methanimicrococcus sp.]|nr:geranylgeranyl reductase family protein [Methanimicrococcus sp.]
MSFPLSQKNYDIVVVGAGPAGSIAAKYAAMGGASVLLAERKKEIGTPIQCAGFVPKAIEIEKLIPGMTLPKEVKKIPQKCVLSKTVRQKLYSPDLKEKEFDVEGYVLDRRLFDMDLAEQAAFEGAELICGTNVHSVLAGSSQYTLRLNGVFGKTEVTTKVIIGADGPNSMIGKTFGLCHAPKLTSPAANAQKAETPETYERGVCFEYKMADVEIETDTLEMYFGNKYVPGGYIWIFPEGEGKANVGIGLRKSLCTENLSAREFLNRFIQEHPVASKKLKGGKITSVIAGIIPVSGAPERTATHSVMVVGDAAGHVMATNGGGIPFAAAAGKIAGKVAAEAVLDHKCGKDLSVLEYESLWRAEFGDALNSSVQARKLMDKFMGSDRMMNAAFKLLPADKLKEMQCGNIPGSLNAGLNLLIK